jgi:hypothetical protein
MRMLIAPQAELNYLKCRPGRAITHRGGNPRRVRLRIQAPRETFLAQVELIKSSGAQMDDNKILWHNTHSITPRYKADTRGSCQTQRFDALWMLSLPTT